MHENTSHLHIFTFHYCLMAEVEYEQAYQPLFCNIYNTLQDTVSPLVPLHYIAVKYTCIRPNNSSADFYTWRGPVLPTLRSCNRILGSAQLIIGTMHFTQNTAQHRMLQILLASPYHCHYVGNSVASNNVLFKKVHVNIVFLDTGFLFLVISTGSCSVHHLISVPHS